MKRQNVPGDCDRGGQAVSRRPMIAKIEWSKKKNAVSPYAVTVPDTSFGKTVYHQCHIRVKANDYIFTSYGKR